MLVYKGRLTNVFKRGDFEDKKSGEIKVGKYQLEFITQKEVIKGQGFQTVLERISIPDSEYSKYSNEIGNDVEVPVGSMAQNNKVILYGIS